MEQFISRYNPVQFIISTQSNGAIKYKKKIETVKHHFPPGVEIVDPEDVDVDNIKNPYFDSETALDSLLGTHDRFKIIKFDDKNNFKIINLVVQE